MRGLTRLVSTLALTASALVVPVVGATSASAATCHEQHFVPSYKPGSVATAATVTHLASRDLPPRTTKTLSVRVPVRTTIRAGATVNGAANAKVANSVIGKAEKAAGVKLERAGGTTGTGPVTVRTTLKNTTQRQQTYVFFSGNTRFGGPVLGSYCKTSGSNDPTGTVAWHRVGTWTSFSPVVTQGAARCGAGAPNELAKQALKLGC